MPDDKAINIPVTLDVKNVRPMRILKPPFENPESLFEKHRVPDTPKKPRFNSTNYAHIDPAIVQLLRPRLARELRKARELNIPETADEKLLRRIKSHATDFIEMTDEGMSKYFKDLSKYDKVMPPGFNASKFIPDTTLTEVTQPSIYEAARDIIDKNNKANETASDIASNVRDILKNVMSFNNGFLESVGYDEEFIRSLSGITDPTKNHLQWIERHYKRREFLERDHQLKLERQEGRASYLNRFFGKFGLRTRDVKNLFDFGKKNFPLKDWGGTKLRLKNMGIGLAISAATFLVKKTFTTLVSTSKKIVGFFTNAAKQAETFQTMVSLAIAPIITMFTLLFIPMLIAMVPLIKTMFDWVLTNKDAIMIVGEKLGSVFNAENLSIVGKALDGILFVLDALANIFTTNASMIDTSSLDRFISSTVLAITNMIQDVLMSIVAFCYSPEGQAFIKSVSYSVGEIIGSIFTTIVALLPVIVESVIFSIIGLINGVVSMISKAFFNLFDVVDRFVGGAISGFLNTIVNLVNTAINALNSINIFGFSPFNIPTLNGGTVGQIGSSVNNFVDQSIVNNFNVNNAMRVSSPSVLKDVMSTGVY